MAINYPDFLNAKIQTPWYAHALEDALKGYKMAKEPAKMAEEAKQRELANKQTDITNKTKQQDLENAPAKNDLEKRYKEALINAANAKANRPPGSALKPSGNTGNIAWIHDQLKNPDLDPEFRKELETEKKNIQANPEVRRERTEQIIRGEQWNKQPAQFKAQQLAIARGMGLSSTEATKAFLEGKTPEDLAKERDIDLKTVDPLYPTSNENIKQGQIKESLLKELVSLEGDLAKVQAGRKFIGFSPSQIVNALKNDNPEEQGMILAANALQPELSALRGRIALPGSTLGIESLREIESRSLGRLKTFEPLVSDKARAAMNKYITSYIQRASGEYNKNMKAYSKEQGYNKQQLPTEQLSNALTNQQQASNSNAPIVAPEIPSWVQNANDFKKWKSSLNPEQIEALRRQHLGE